MKGLFAFCMVFAALVCFAMPTDCKASVMPVDNDVGFVQSPSVDDTQFIIEIPVSKAIEFVMATTQPQARIYEYDTSGVKTENLRSWVGGDTKARLCTTSGGSCFVDGALIKTIPKA